MRLNLVLSGGKSVLTLETAMHDGGGGKEGPDILFTNSHGRCSVLRRLASGLKGAGTSLELNRDVKPKQPPLDPWRSLSSLYKIEVLMSIVAASGLEQRLAAEC